MSPERDSIEAGPEPGLSDVEQRAMMTLVLMAAFADGRNDSVERAQVARVVDSLSLGATLNVAEVYQDVLLKRVTLNGAAGTLASQGARHLAYELCVGVCDADDMLNDAERAFLSTLQSTLGFDAAEIASARTFTADADTLAAAPLATLSSVEPAAPTSTMTAGEQERFILNYAILNGALELLPDSLASIAIVPLQMKMVYRIGHSYGFELDRAHVREFLATAGVGFASQYVEQVGVKLISKVLGRGVLGGLLGSAARQTVSSGFSFATTYALGRLAVRYYAGGRTLSTRVLQDTYAGLLGEAKSLQEQYLPAIQERARTVNVPQLLQEVRR